jgi:hypothetical protein
VIVRSGPAFTVGTAFAGALITRGISMTAAELAGASAVLPAFRAHALMMYELAIVGVHVKEAVVDQSRPTCVDAPFTIHHLY